jgi:hypothetical protein
MDSDELKTYYCERIKKNVFAEGMDDLTRRIIVQCKYDNNKQGNSCIYFDYMCFIGFPPKRCLVKLTVQRDIKKEKKLI